jgi:hypothetical protein
MKGLVMVSLFWFGFVMAESRTQAIEMSIKLSGKDLILEVTPETRSGFSEMSFYIYKPGNPRNFIRRIIPAQNGIYRLMYTFPEDGYWDINLRYGIGLDRYYANLDLRVDQRSQTYNRRTVFHGDLDNQTPNYIQSIGFGVFALLLFITLSLITTILRWLKRGSETRDQGSEIRP